MKSPFKFLDAYTRKDKENFFGREEEVASLYNMVHKNRLVLVYGQSGTGKTSLVQCGLAGRFEITDWYPLNIRRGKDINDSFSQVLQNAINGEHLESIPESIEEIYATFLRPVYLIFDQFEELFILGSKDEQDIFIQSIAAILKSGIACRIIFVMREEFLGHLYDFENVVPNLFDRRLRVERMNLAKVKLVLIQSFEKFNITLEPPVDDRLQQMIQKISSGKAWIQLPYLQVYLDLLYREDYQRTYQENHPVEELPPLEFTKAEIADFGKIETVLEKFLFEQQHHIQIEIEEIHQEVPENLAHKILNVFVTGEGTKQPINYWREGDKILLEQKDLMAIPGPILTHCLEALERSRILRFSDVAIELAHDSLAELIDRSRSNEERQLNEVNNHIQNNYQEFLKTGEYLSSKQINIYEDFLPKLNLEDNILNFILDSRKKINEEKVAEKEKNEKELREARERVESETRLKNEAQAERQKAVDAAQLAEEAKNEAEEKGKKAIEEKIKAERAQKIARRNFKWSMIAAALMLVSIIAAIAGFGNLIWAYKAIVGQALVEIDNHILQLDYPSAEEKTITTLKIPRKKKETCQRLQEIAYFYVESGQFDRAETILQEIGVSINVSTDLSEWRNKIKRISPEYYDTLENRYYPSMVLVPEGEFELNFVDTTINSFHMATTEITVCQYHLYLKANGKQMPEAPSWGWIGNNPMVNVSWYDAIFYMNWLSDQRGFEDEKVYDLPDIKDPNELHGMDSVWHELPNWKAKGFRLPTEAEWEYAARGGPLKNTFLYSGHSEIDSVAWYQSNSESRTHKVGTLKANQLLLFDMTGNVLEWCYDFDNESKKVLRGGSWDDFNYQCTVNHPYGYQPNQIDSKFGFRCIRTQ